MKESGSNGVEERWSEEVKVISAIYPITPLPNPLSPTPSIPTTPMLSRVADSIYWLNRYVERAENVARFVDVNLNLLLDAPTGMEQQ
ncbi:MAG: alpha-E domain-containing protein, partial [Nodosilinea sp.]